MQEICSTSHLKISPERPAAGNTCASMEILRILGPKPHQTDEFWGDFFFPEALGDPNRLFLMFFDVLEVYGPPWNDSEWILDYSFFIIFYHFLSIIFGLRSQNIFCLT